MTRFHNPTASHSRQFATSLAGFACLFALIGCGQGPQAEFSWRDGTTNLIRPAEKAVKDTINENFGTPQHLVAWERMPVEYGGVRADVASADKPGVFTLALTDPQLVAQIHPGQSVLWLSGAHAGQATGETVKSVDAKTLQITTAGGDAAPAAGDKVVLGFGSQLQLGRVVYMKNCMHCHGVAGDGAGPTAKYLNPLPRDYRLGIFKFTSTLPQERARRDDLQRVVKYGIPGTYMPSSLLFTEEENAAVVEYVRWLSMRGELEKRLDDELADYNEATIRRDAERAVEAHKAAVKAGEKPEKPVSPSQAVTQSATDFAAYAKEEFPEVVDSTADILAEVWPKAEEESSLVRPALARVEDTTESRLRGRVLYMSNRTKCYTCHGPLGRGDGNAIDDFWPKPGTNEKYAQRGLHDLWGHKLQPRDLTRNQYRGGRRPVDLYRRVFSGIKGTPMPAFGGTVLKDEEIWDLVNYVMSIPFDTPSATAVKPPAMAQVEEAAQ
jgi:mono/diheme cytochrome c family protein